MLNFVVASVLAQDQGVKDGAYYGQVIKYTSLNDRRDTATTDPQFYEYGEVQTAAPPAHDRRSTDDEDEPIYGVEVGVRPSPEF